MTPLDGPDWFAVRPLLLMGEPFEEIQNLARLAINDGPSSTVVDQDLILRVESLVERVYQNPIREVVMGTGP